MRERYARTAVAAIFFVYVLYIRIFDIADTFLMLGEQIRDWRIALGGLADLPLTGAPSTAGGRGFGPVYYWVLWLGRHLIGPFTDNLPHAGGITVALLQSAADTWLLVALWARVGPWLAAAMGLLIASAPFDVAISAVIWNPPVAAALIKMATAMALGLGTAPPRWKVAVTAMLAWMAVQAHLSAIFVAAPLLLALVAADLKGLWKAEGAVATHLQVYRSAALTAGTIAGVILALQVPYLVAVLRDPSAPIGPTTAISTMANAEAFHLDRSFSAVVNATGDLLARQYDAWRFQVPTLVAAAILIARWRRDVVLLAVSVGGLAGGTLLFATWTRGFDSYWFLTLIAAMVLTYGMAVAALPSRMAVHAVGAALLAAMVALQPARLEQSAAFFKYPAYRAMRLASYELAATHPVLRDIRINFEGVHPTMDKYFIYTILGGRIDPAAAHRAFVNADGSVSID